MESVVTKQFTSRAALNGLFLEKQSAYRQFHCTESSVLVLHNYIICAIDQGEVWSSTLGPELCIRYCRPHLTAVAPWVSIFGHRTVTGMIPLILDGPCTGVYYPVQSDFPDTTNIRYLPGLRPWSNNVYQLYQEHYSDFFPRTPSNIICLPTILNPMTTVLYQQFCLC